MPLSGYIVVIRQDGVEGPTCEWCSWKCTIGRDPSCDISINLPTVAPVHCSLELLNNGLVQATSQLEDKFSMLINGVPLKGSCILSNACLLTAGDRKFRFFYPSSRKSVHFQSGGNPSPAATPTAAGDVICNSQTPQSITKSLKIATPDSMPKVHPTKKFTPKPASVSPARSPRPVHITPKSTLGTRERYGPVPLRPPPTSPAIQVVRHAPAKSPLKSISSDVSKGRRSNTGIAQVHCTPKGRTSSTLRKSSTFTPKSAKRPNEISSRRNLTPQSPRLNTVFLRSPTPRKMMSPLHPNITTKSPATGLVSSNVLPLRTAAHVSRSSPSNRKNVSQKNSPHSTSRKSSHKVDIQTDPPTLKSTPEFDFKEDLSNDSPSTATKTKYAQSQEFKPADVYRACPATAHHSRRNLKRPSTARVSMLTENILTAASKRTKGVSFGPALSPEQFDKCLPPSTPVKKGAIPPIVCTPQSLSSPKLRSPTPFVKKTTPMCEKTPNRTTATLLLSPSYIPTTPNRISGVISQPPTPDTNLLDSISEYDSILRSVGAYPVATAHYSAPVSKSKLTKQTNIKANCRHSFALGSTHFISQYSEQKTLRVPPSTPASIHRYSYSDQRNVSKLKLSPSRDSTDSGILLNQTKHGLHISPSCRSRQRSPGTTPSTASFTAADLFTSNESISNSSEKVRVSRSSSLLLPVKHSPVSTPNTIQRSSAKTLSVIGVGRSRKTLESAITRRLSNATGTFEKTSEVASPARGVGRPRSSSAPSSDKRSSVSVHNLVQRSTSKTPNMAGMRRMLKTPKSAVTPRLSGVAVTPRLSGVAGMFEESSEVVSPARGVGRPRSSSALSDEKRSSIGSPKGIRRAAAKTPHLTGVRRLLKIPQIVKSPRSTRVRQILLSPRTLASPSLSGLRRLLKTPKLCVSPRLSGLADLLPFSPKSQRNPAINDIKLIRKASRRQISVSSRLVRKRALPSKMSNDICDVPLPKTSRDTSLQAVPVRSTRAGSKRPPKSTSNSVALPVTSPTEPSRATARKTSRPKLVRAPSVSGVGSPSNKRNKTKVNAIPAATEPKPAQKRTPVKSAPLRVTRQRRALVDVNKAVGKPKEEPSSPTRRGRAVRIKKTPTAKRSVSKTVGSNTTTTITRVLDSPVSSVRPNRKRKSVSSTKGQAKKPRSTMRATKKTTTSLSSPVHSHVVISPRRTRAANRIRK
ncbi:hypothetical protein PHET_04873 [Paragonimus heterotremus]|uniref:FHA domain-containing protein n=1 Tax=Paragonimus heterotremus TaxID=100268 RepID=A0A8J4T105_9TREM|nr:hypothetical protein PHET_04873 [Paragonimus heterotremus]